MVYKITDGKAVRASLRTDFPNTSFPSDCSRASLPDGYIFVCQSPAPECGKFERAIEGDPQIIDGSWRQTWVVSAWSEEEVLTWRESLECGPYQMALALGQMGLLATVDAMVAQVGGMTEFAWKRATVFKRTDPLIETMRQALGKTPEEVDNLFLLAQTL